MVKKIQAGGERHPHGESEGGEEQAADAEFQEEWLADPDGERGGQEDAGRPLSAGHAILHHRAGAGDCDDAQGVAPGGGAAADAVAV